MSVPHAPACRNAQEWPDDVSVGVILYDGKREVISNVLKQMKTEDKKITVLSNFQWAIAPQGKTKGQQLKGKIVS